MGGRFATVPFSRRRPSHSPHPQIIAPLQPYDAVLYAGVGHEDTGHDPHLRPRPAAGTRRRLIAQNLKRTGELRQSAFGSLNAAFRSL